MRLSLKSLTDTPLRRAALGAAVGGAVAPFFVLGILAWSSGVNTGFFPLGSVLAVLAGGITPAIGALLATRSEDPTGRGWKGVPLASAAGAYVWWFAAAFVYAVWARGIVEGAVGGGVPGGVPILFSLYAGSAGALFGCRWAERRGLRLKEAAKLPPAEALAELQPPLLGVTSVPGRAALGAFIGACTALGLVLAVGAARLSSDASPFLLPLLPALGAYLLLVRPPPAPVGWRRLQGAAAFGGFLGWLPGFGVADHLAHPTQFHGFEEVAFGLVLPFVATTGLAAAYCSLQLRRVIEAAKAPPPPERAGMRLEARGLAGLVVLTILLALPQVAAVWGRAAILLFVVLVPVLVLPAVAGVLRVLWAVDSWSPQKARRELTVASLYLGAPFALLLIWVALFVAPADPLRGFPWADRDPQIATEQWLRVISAALAVVSLGTLWLFLSRWHRRLAKEAGHPTSPVA